MTLLMEAPQDNTAEMSVVDHNFDFEKEVKHMISATAGSAPDRGRIVHLNRTTLRLWEWGDPADPPIICAHGAHDHGRMWDGFAPLLAGAGILGVALGFGSASGFGFGIVQADVSGNRYLSREEILERAGITPQTSLLLLDAERVRAALQDDMRIAEASVRKFYPDRLEIAIEEREGFARWQRAGKLHLISRDGTVLKRDIGRKAIDLPLVVGVGADKKAAAFLELIGRFPAVRESVRAGILVAERRWNLHLKNGIDVHQATAAFTAGGVQVQPGDRS